MKFLNTKLVLLSLVGLSFGQEDDDVRPAPPSIGADVPVTYFGPAPSTVQPELIGPHQLLTAGVLDTEAGTITLPLYKGRMYSHEKEFPPSGGLRSNSLSGENRQANGAEGAEGFPFMDGATVWYILTDTTDEGAAKALGLNFASKLRFTSHGRGARMAEYGEDLYLNFEPSSIVDFSPVHTVVPGEPPNFFPPTTATPGSVGADDYSPIIYISNIGEFYNAPVVADRFATEETLNQWCDGIPEVQLEAARALVHDKVVAICPEEQTVTLSLTPGHSFARPVLYLSMDAIDQGVAALEGATYAPGMEDIAVGADDSFGSAVERIFVVANGYTNGDLPENSSVTSHPLRNGLNSALRGDGPPFNVLGGIPTIATDYSPLWDVNVGMWTDEAVAGNFRTRWLEEFQILGFVARGLVTGPGGSEFGSTGNLVNCPIVHRFL